MTSDSQSAATLVANLKTLGAQIHSNSGDPAIWTALERTLSQQFGYSLFTILVFLPSRSVTRVYSTNEDLHPLGRRTPASSSSSNKDSKGSDDTPPSRAAWIQRVLVDGETWRGSTREDLKAVFEDWEQLWRVGLGSVLNIPVRVDGQTIGSLNILDKEHAYDAADLEVSILIAQIVAFYIYKVGEGVAA